MFLGHFNENKISSAVSETTRKYGMKISQNIKPLCFAQKENILNSTKILLSDKNF